MGGPECGGCHNGAGEQGAAQCCGDSRPVDVVDPAGEDDGQGGYSDAFGEDGGHCHSGVLPAFGEGEDEGDVHDEIEEYDVYADANGGAGVLCGVEGGDEYFCGAEDDEAGGVEGEGAGAEDRGLLIEGTTVPLKDGL